jgi:hypothetical protein
MSHHEQHGKKHKKLAQLLKNKRQQIRLEQEGQLALSRDLEKEREEEVREALTSASRRGAAKKGEEPAWSARMQMVRDKNTGRREMASERWNRFAGTAAAGGRGL